MTARTRKWAIHYAVSAALIGTLGSAFIISLSNIAPDVLVAQAVGRAQP